MDTKSLVQPHRRRLFSRKARELAGVLSVPSRPIVTTSNVDVYRGVWGSPRGERIDVAVKEFKTLAARSMHSDPQALQRRMNT
ncbi:hypothetical protein FS837_000888, partial [Tulasnella sp. UAMH 9824]